MSEKRAHGESAPIGDLRADCENCFALCCVVPAFSASTDFAITKNAGQPCPHLQPDFRCGIHTRLRQQGFRGCTVYDCFGAGQKVSQVTFGGQDWRRAPHTAKQMFAVFPIMRDLHELLWYLTEALTLQPAHPLHAELSLALKETERLTHNGPDALMAARRGSTPTRRQCSAAAHKRTRASHSPTQEEDLRGADLIGAKLKGANLEVLTCEAHTSLELISRDADLRMADLTGADFRDADLRGANLTESIFLIQSQLDAAKGDTKTKLPPSLTRPTHWYEAE